jgi:hypothetical protein
MLQINSRELRWLAAASLFLSPLLATPASAQGGLTAFKNHFVTGDYVAAGVALENTGVGGLATGTITIDPASIPSDAEIVAAYLYWFSVSSSGAPASTAVSGARFKDNAIGDIAVLLNPAGSAPCWSDGGATGSSQGSKAIWSYRADVLRFFTRRRPADRTQPVTVEVGGAHTVQLPDAGGSNQLPSALGAGLLVVYRVTGYDDASGNQVARQPLRAVVINDGSAVMDNSTRGIAVTLEGFYEAARVAPNARLSLFVANGQSNKPELVMIRSTASSADNRVVATNPFVSDAGFEVSTFADLPLEPGAMKATVSVEPGTQGSFDCVNVGAIVMSTEVQDRDADGLLDVWEARSEWSTKPARLASVYQSWPLTAPHGGALPDLEGMGASPSVQDVFLQIDYLVGAGHSHLPSRAALDSVTVALRNAAPRPNLVARGLCAAGAARGQCPINLHFDVGANYQSANPPSAAACAAAAMWTPQCAIVRASLATGGNAIPETECRANGTTPTGRACAFPGHSGVVGWKNGLRAYRDEAGPTGSPRFARNRKDIFRYGLFAHALGLASITRPGAPAATSGIADSGGGGDFMVTLGLWDGQTGSDFVQGATLLHELGHTFGLRHGGIVPSGFVEPNCKPNYQSVMNYLFQARGLLDSRGVAVLDFSRQKLPSLNEGALAEVVGFGVSAEYLARWYAPQSGSFIDRALGTSPATRLCDGTPLPAGGISYVRVDATPRGDGAIDWSADGQIVGAASQDANFDGLTPAAPAGPQTFLGADDFATLDLRQTGARRPVGSASVSYDVVDPLTGVPPVPPLFAVGGAFSLDTGYGDLGYGDLGYGDLGYGDLGYGDLGYGDLGYGDLGYGDLGYGDLGAPSESDDTQGLGDLNVETAGSLGNAPTGLAATVLKKGGILLQWSAPHVGTVLSYDVYRVIGTSITPQNFAARVAIGPIGASTAFVTDNNNLKRKVTYTYIVVANLAPTADCQATAGNSVCRSGVSNYTTVTY